MKITFTTKAESKRLQEEAFLKLAGAERFFEFLRLCEKINAYPTTAIKEKNNNFIINIKTKNS